ncbi:MAG TPA: SDR family oxidoreductase [Polyangiaceae bacterium]|nr:SDR family oxidoreductase [Polyangiaceae bacterium]
MDRLKGRVVVVTGGSAGLGRAIVRAFAARGANVGVVARESRRLHDTERELELLGVRALAVPVDVADGEALDAAAERIEAAIGPIDVWVNNAMTTVFSRFDEMSPAEFRRVTEVTYLGFVNGTMAALRRMRRRNRGTIVQVGSALAYRSIPLQSAYCGAKHAIRGFTNSLRSELIHDRSAIRLTMVHMPGLNTPQFDWCENHLPREAQPVGVVLQPEVGARAVVWSALHRRRELDVGWTVLKTIVGNKGLPGYGDRLAARKAYEPQMAPEPKVVERRRNLYEPVELPVAARGRFDRARSWSPELWLSTHRRSLLVALFAAGGLFMALRRRRVSASWSS